MEWTQGGYVSLIKLEARGGVWWRADAVDPLRQAFACWLRLESDWV